MNCPNCNAENEIGGACGCTICKSCGVLIPCLPIEIKTEKQNMQEKIVKNYMMIFGNDYDIPRDFQENPLLDSYKCPRCNKRGLWRRGMEFEDMMRCPSCKIVWKPGSIESLKSYLAEEQQGIFGDGI